MNQPERQQTEAPGKVIYTAKTRTPPAAGNTARRAAQTAALRCQAFHSRLRADRNQSGAVARRRLVGLFRKRDGNCGPQRRLPCRLTLAIDAEVDVNQSNSGYFLRVRLNVSVPGVEREVARGLVEEADQTCPYSKATRGNIDVSINLV